LGLEREQGFHRPCDFRRRQALGFQSGALLRGDVPVLRQAAQRLLILGLVRNRLGGLSGQSSALLKP
jgi:hypothetical protein